MNVDDLKFDRISQYEKIFLSKIYCDLFKLTVNDITTIICDVFNNVLFSIVNEVVYVSFELFDSQVLPDHEIRDLCLKYTNIDSDYNILGGRFILKSVDFNKKESVKILKNEY